MTKKGTPHVSFKKQYKIPADLRPLGNIGSWIIEASRIYYRNRPVHLIGTGIRCKRKKK